MPSFRCRSCGGVETLPVLSLGQLPLANRLLAEGQLGEPEPRYRLDLVFCQSCTLTQITETVAPEVLFRDYVYFSSVSETMLNSSEALANHLVNSRQLGNDALVVEIGSNDGYLLQFYQRRGVPVLGIDPALNIVRVAQDERGIPTLGEFFSEALAHEMTSRGQRASVIHANNVLAHVADLNGVVAGIRELLAVDGIAVIEVPYVRDLVDRGEFDTIYHEHLCYFSVLSLDSLLARHGLAIRDVERIPIHGGSLRVFVGHGTQRGEAVESLLARERELGMDRQEYYAGLGESVTSVRESLLHLLGELKRQHKRIAAYGAAAKGATLLGYCGVDRTVLEYVVDRNPHKQGHYLPGVHIPIVGPDRLEVDRPDYLLVLAWNLAEEVMQQQAGFRESGGQFIVPVPRAHVVE